MESWGGAITLPTTDKYLEGDIVIAEEGGGTVISDVLEENEWSVISEVAKAGEGASYWGVGDTKSVKLRGIVGTLPLSITLYAYIIGINHRDIKGVTFQGFKMAGTTTGINACLVDSGYGTNSSDGTLRFNLNHWGSSSSPYNTNYGGWKGCDLRYDILGSTDKSPSGYGATATTSRTGYDASDTTATSPKSDTLMSCLSSDLRAVMRPMTIYTDNVGGTGNASYYVTASIDYLPLLAEFEIFGESAYANQYEKTSQSQYAYYKVGNSKVKYRNSATGSTAYWWERSPSPVGTYYFCIVDTNGGASNIGSRTSRGLAPIFLV